MQVKNALLNELQRKEKDHTKEVEKKTKQTKLLTIAVEELPNDLVKKSIYPTIMMDTLCMYFPKTKTALKKYFSKLRKRGLKIKIERVTYETNKKIITTYKLEKDETWVYLTIYEEQKEEKKK